jgi:sarcosine oxidase subunit alpha
VTQPFRNPTGGEIARWQVLRFRFDGRDYEGHPGDTLASALLANGVHLVGRSFKYHRPRGILGHGAEEPNALVRLSRGRARQTPNLRATQIELYDGLEASSQNRFPSLRWDWGAVASLAAPLLPAGFYYKTFMPSLAAWRNLFEPLIRRAAGLGRVPAGPDPDRYANRFAHCDVLVVGAGPAGLAAARAAARAGARVILADEQPAPGGALLDEPDAMVEGAPARDWIAAMRADLAGQARVRVLPRTTAFGYYADNFLALVERRTDHLAIPDADAPRERLWQVRARQVVLATGAIERALVFPGNDRPGIMLASAARAYLARHAVRAGRRAVIFAAHDSGYDTAHALRAGGVEVARIVDPRPDGDTQARARARAAGFAVSPASTITGTDGHLHVHTLHIGRLGADGSARAEERLHADLVLMAGGFSPAAHLFAISRGRLRWDEALFCHVPDEPAQATHVAGACRGVFELADVVTDGTRAGEEAARDAGCAAPAARRAAPRAATGNAAAPTPGSGKFAFADFQNDVTASDISLAVREGFGAVEHLKRYTTAGMATDQGKLANPATLPLLAAARGVGVGDLGHTTYRAPYTPVTFGSLAGAARGALFEPVRRTPLHEAAAALGAVFEDVGQWRRARYFPRAGEDMAMAVARECRAVRAAVGLFDASTLGKIDVSGSDAAEFLDRIYMTTLRTLPVGRARYAIMLTEAGFVLDDGIVARLAPDRFHVTTTTGGAARVLAHMEDYRQTEWPHLDVWLTSVTEQFAVLAVQGPRARAVLAPLLTGIDLARLPHMAQADGQLRGMKARVFRVSFTGELGYEINLRPDDAPAAWDLLRDAVLAQGGVAYGTEAMHVLRAEKGYIIVGQETDGTVSPDDLGFGALGRGKCDFVGKRSLSLPDMRAPGRLQLVGLLTEDAATLLEEGAQLVAQPNPQAGTKALGHVTSAYRSPALDRPIALALLADGRARHGETVHATAARFTVPARVVAPVFHDPEGTRLDG